MDNQLGPLATGLEIVEPLALTRNRIAAPAGSVNDVPDTGTRQAYVPPALDDTEWIAPLLRGGAFAIVVFQIGYTLLDTVEYPHTLIATLPLHIASMALALFALMATLAPFAMRHWRAFALGLCSSIMLLAAWIGVVNSDGDVLVASLVLSFVGASALIPWSPRWQVAFDAAGALALLVYSMRTADPDPRLGISWMIILSAALLSMLCAVHSARGRRRSADQLAALAENHEREMLMRAENAAARDRDHAQLQASEAMLRKVFDASPDSIAINSLRDGRFIAVNDNYQVAGYTCSDVLGNNVFALRMWPLAEELNRFREEIHTTGRVKNMEITQRRMDGTIETNLISASMVEVNGEPCAISMTRDITAIKRVETDLRASHAAMRKIFDATLDIIVVTRMSDGSHIDFNQQFERLGYRRQDLDDSRAGKREIWASADQHREFRDRVMADGVVRNMEVDFILPDGSLMPALASAVRIDLEGEDCVVTMIRDLTATRDASRKLEESVKALRASEETFRKLFDANLDSMTLSGVDGIYLDVNQEFCRATGFSREEAVGHHFTELNLWIHPDEMIAFSDHLFRTNEIRNLEVAIRYRDGSEHPVLISAVNLELHGQLCCLTISREISDIKMTQRELVGAREAALAASQAKSEFLSSMSHEIRTPMNAILGMAELLMETVLDDEQRRYLSTVISNSHALLELINSILDLAKVESGRLSLEAVEFDPRDVTEKALETLAIRAHEKGLELMVRFAPEVPELALGDPLRLGQILINLIGNAIKFTPKGQVLVSVEHDSDSAGPGGLKFTVTDTGIGIPSDKLHLLFNAFSQADSSTSRKYGGSGLGLAIVSRLVALMHGKVEVASDPGTGSAFSFTAQFGTAKPWQVQSKPDQALRGVSIILVDDNSDNRSIVADLLTAQGAQVTSASSRIEALNELARDVVDRSRFQIILLDATMPDHGGFDVARRLASGGRGRPQIVMMLGTNDLTIEVARLRAIGVDNYVVKPVRRAELLAAIARARAGVKVKLRGEGLAPSALPPTSISSLTLDRPLQILIADDSHDNRALIRAYLRKTLYSLQEAEDGRQAIDKFIAGEFDLVLMDIQMPIVDGYAATASIRRWERANNRRRTPIVALTASALEEAVHRTKAAGCDAHVTKPVRKSTLLEAIREAVEGTSVDERVKDASPKEETCPTG